MEELCLTCRRSAAARVYEMVSDLSILSTFLAESDLELSKEELKGAVRALDRSMEMALQIGIFLNKQDEWSNTWTPNTRPGDQQKP